MSNPSPTRDNLGQLARAHGPRFLKFGAVGVLGIGVNLGMYALFYDLIGIPDFIARGLAIEVAVIHNYSWNFFWTWADRGRTQQTYWQRMLRYHGSTFLASFAIPLGVGWLLDLLLAGMPWGNYISHLGGIAVGMAVNYLLSDRWVFRVGGTSMKDAQDPGSDTSS